MALIDFLAKRIKEGDVAFPQEIETDNYVFIYSPQDKYSFQLWEDYVNGMGVLEVRKWEGYKLYCTKVHPNKGFYNSNFYVECPSGDVYFFTMHSKRTPISELLWKKDSE